MNGFDLLGAADAFSDQYITVRVKSIDREKLKRAIGGSKGAIASSALSIVDSAPKAVLDIVKPVVVNKARDYGIDAEVVVSNVPPSKGGRAFSEFWPGLATGIGIGAMSLLIWKGVARLVGRD